MGSPTGKAYARLSFGEAADIYLGERVDRVAERTIQFEKERLVPLRRHLGLQKLASLKAETIAAYQQARIKEGVSGRTVNMEVSVLGRMLKKAKLWLQMADDITKYPERSNVGQALQADEKTVLFETAGRRPSRTGAHCGAVLAASTTCRGVELKGVIDTIGIMGYCQLLAMVMNTARTPLRDGLEPGLRPFPR